MDAKQKNEANKHQIYHFFGRLNIFKSTEKAFLIISIIIFAKIIKSINYRQFITKNVQPALFFAYANYIPKHSFLTVQPGFAADPFNSCMNNYFEYKGIKGRFDIWRLIRRKDVSDALEDSQSE